MKKTIIRTIIIFAVFLFILLAGPFFTINEGEQAVVVRFGKIVNVYTNAGLKIKIPFIDEVVRYSKKIMAWDGEARIVPTAERQFIFVDVVARWRISDPQKFYESIGTVNEAFSKLAEIIDSEVRTVVAENNLHESVRNSDIIIEHLRDPARNSNINIEIPLENDPSVMENTEPEIISSSMPQNELSGSSIDPVVKGRRKLAEEILTRSRGMVHEYGIELIDVVTRQISYSPELTDSVYARMRRERNQIAMHYRSEGEGRKAEWLGRMENEKMAIRSAAYSRSETIRAEADAEASRIYASAYNQNADRRNFYAFWRAIQSYRETMPNFDKTLTTDMDYFRYLYSSDGRR